MIEDKFEDIFSFSTIYNAHKRGRISKRDKKSLVRFEIGNLYKLYDIFSKVKEDKFKIDRYNTFVIFEPKKREIQTLHYSQRVVQHVICDDLLAPYFTRKAILDNCVCQKGKGMHYALRRFEEKLKKFVHDNGQNGYVLKCDILKYFPSLSHRVLINCIANEIKDERLKSMVVKIIQSFHTRPEFLQRYGIERIEFEGDKTGRGVPIGNQTSQIFGMFYLDKLDRIIKEKFRVKIYSRYMDDFVIVHKDKNFLKYLLKEITAQLDKLDLSLNSRTQIFPLKNGLTYLGFRYQISKTGKLIKKVSNKTAKRFRRRTRLIQIAYSEGFIDKTKARQSLQAYHGHLMHGDCFKLEKKVSKPILKLIK